MDKTCTVSDSDQFFREAIPGAIDDLAFGSIGKYLLDQLLLVSLLVEVFWFVVDLRVRLLVAVFIQLRRLKATQ